jgi:transmembrane sensor
MSSKQIEALAAAWLARRESGHFSAADAAELANWLQASTAHRVTFLRLESAWEQAGRLKVLGAGVKSGVVPSAREWQQSPYFTGSYDDADRDTAKTKQRRTLRFRARRHISMALAASILLTIIAGSLWIAWPRGPAYQTQVGVSATVPMTDGSKVILSTNSKIHVAVSTTERRVELDRGEAFFEVAEDPARPFVVSAGALRVVAVGTKFSVRREGSEFRVVVTEGRVRVEKIEGGREVTLTQIAAGDIAHSRGEGVLVQHQPLQQVEEVLSWRDGFVVFHETPLADAVAELNRYNTRKIVIKDPGIAAIRISGNFRAANGEAFALLLEDGFPIRAEVSGNEITLNVE